MLNYYIHSYHRELGKGGIMTKVAWIVYVMVVCLILAPGIIFSGCKRANKTSGAEAETKIEGVVAGVEYHDDNYYTVLRFQDGRVRLFCNLSEATFYLGRHHVISLDCESCGCCQITGARLSDPESVTK